MTKQGSREFLLGRGAGQSFETHKMPDGRYKITTNAAGATSREWFGNDEQEALSAAKKDLYDAALKGEL